MAPPRIEETKQKSMVLPAGRHVPSAGAITVSARASKEPDVASPLGSTLKPPAMMIGFWICLAIAKTARKISQLRSEKPSPTLR